MQQPEVKAPAVVVKTRAAAPPRTAREPEPPARAARGSRSKVTATLALGEPPGPAPTPAPPRARETSDPFAGETDGADKPATVARVGSEPAPAQSKLGKSGDGLDDLMAGVASGNGSKPSVKRTTSKEIDAVLKDVQKDEPAPKPRRPEPVPLPSLTAADITTAMAGVKVDANACSKRFGQSGVADLGITVGKDGRVTDVDLRGSLADLPIAQCIAKAVRRATFPRNSGLRFDYRINVQ